MFDSNLIRDYGTEIKDAIWDRQKEIVEFPYDLWMSSENSGEDIFDGYFREFFPPGFIDRDKERARKVMRDIYDIVQSPTIRHSPEPIYCYVMYHLIEAWFDDDYTKTIDLVPDDVKAFAAKLEEDTANDKETDNNSSEENQYDDPSDSELIIAWFSDKDSCLGDIEDTYDQDYTDEIFAEEIAEIYLKEGKVPESLGADIRELIDLLPNDLYEKVSNRLKKEDSQTIIEANQYVDKIWPQLEGFFHVLSHSEPEDVSSWQGTMKILEIFRDWVENNGGWRNIQDAKSSTKEAAIHRMILLGSKVYLENQNLDMNCENNIGVGQEDIKISRGNDKTIVEVKLSNNPTCKHGYEKQLMRYAETEHTSNSIFCLIDLGDPDVVDMIKELRDKGKEMGRAVPDLVIINAKPQKPASIC